MFLIIISFIKVRDLLMEQNCDGVLLRYAIRGEYCKVGFYRKYY